MPQAHRSNTSHTAYLEGGLGVGARESDLAEEPFGQKAQDTVTHHGPSLAVMPRTLRANGSKSSHETIPNSAT